MNKEQVLALAKQSKAYAESIQIFLDDINHIDPVLLLPALLSASAMLDNRINLLIDTIEEG